MACRSTFERRFAVRRMARDYVAAYALRADRTPSCASMGNGRTAWRSACALGRAEASRLDAWICDVRPKIRADGAAVRGGRSLASDGEDEKNVENPPSWRFATAFRPARVRVSPEPMAQMIPEHFAWFRWAPASGGRRVGEEEAKVPRVTRRGEISCHAWDHGGDRSMS